MTLFHKIILPVLALALMLGGCGNSGEPTVPTDSTEIITLPPPPEATGADAVTEDPYALVEEVTAVLTAGELYTLDHYPNLQAADLSGSVCYDAILDYIAEHPQVDVTYTVDLGGTWVSNKVSSATVEPTAMEFGAMLENLQYLPALTELSLPNVSLTAQEAQQLKEAYPGIALNYTVELLGNSYTSADTTLDLTGLGSEEVEGILPKLGLLTGLTDVQLSGGLSLTDVAKLQDANPLATFHYSFAVFGKSLSTTDTEVVFKNHSIGNDGEEKLRQVLDVMDDCQRFVLDNCKIDYTVLDQLREDYRGKVKVVWRIYFGKDSRYTALTDTDLIRAVYNVTDSTCSAMRYCEDVKYMDIGHNDTLTDLSFIGYMPNIEVLIASGCAAKELVGFDNCKKLTWLELANCYKLTNIDTLAGCESLTYLNLSNTKVSNYMPLDSLPLQRFMCLRPKASTEEQNTFLAIHPKEECLTVFYGYTNEYGYGWRYDDNGKTFNAYYRDVVRKAFNYDYLESLIPKDDKKK